MTLTFVKQRQLICTLNINIMNNKITCITLKGGIIIENVSEKPLGLKNGSLPCE